MDKKGHTVFDAFGADPPEGRCPSEPPRRIFKEMKRKILLVICVLSWGSGALAVGPPGPPPWTCTSHETCESDTCIRLPGVPTEFSLYGSPDLPTAFVAEGANDHQKIAMRYPTLDTALHVIDRQTMPDGVSLILIDTNKVADAHGFLVHDLSRRGTGEIFVSSYSLLIACNSTRGR